MQFRFVLAMLLVSATAHGFAAGENQAAVNLQFDRNNPHALDVQGKTYRMRVNTREAFIESFVSGDNELIGEHPLCPVLSMGRVHGPASLEIIQLGTQLCELRLRGLRWTTLDADIDLVLYCYPRHVFAAVEVVPRSSVDDLVLGWYGNAKYSTPLNLLDEEVEKRTTFGEEKPHCVVAIPPPIMQHGRRLQSANLLEPPLRVATNYRFPGDYAGTRRAAVILLGADSHDELQHALRGLWSLFFADVRVGNGRLAEFAGYGGFFDIEADTSAQPVTVDATIAKSEATLKRPVDMVFRVRGVGRNALLKDAGASVRGDNLQISATSDVWFTATVARDEPYSVALAPCDDASVRLVSDRAGIRSRYGEQSVFRYLFQPRLDSDSSGFRIEAPGAGVSVVRHDCGGRRVSQLLDDTRIYLTGPLLANVGAQYSTNDDALGIAIEAFEHASADFRRSFVKVVIDVRKDVELDRPLVLFDAVASEADWESIVYFGADGTNHQVELSASASHTAEALHQDAAYVAAHSADHGLGFFVNRVTGSVSGAPLNHLAIRNSQVDGRNHVALEVPGLQLNAGDRIEAHVFLMSYAAESPETAGAVMNAQRTMFADGLAKIDARMGELGPGYPRRVRLVDGCAEFDITGASGRTPVIIDGIPSDRHLLLWQKDAEGWQLFHSLRDAAADRAYQTWLGSDGTTSAVFFVDLNAEAPLSLAATTAGGIESAAADRGRLVLTGKALEVVAPIPFVETSEPIPGTPFYRSRAGRTIQLH